MLNRIDLAHIILRAPAWAQLGLTMRDERMRERAADCLAATIVERIKGDDQPDHRQMALPL